MKLKIAIIALLLGIAFLTLFWMNWNGNQLNRFKNGFNRIFLKEPAVKLYKASFENQFYNLCGSTPDNLYFSDEKPGRISVCDYTMSSVRTIDLSVPDYNYLRPVFYTSFDSPVITIMAGNMHTILQLRLDNQRTKRTNVPISSFSNAVYIEQNAVVFRSMDGSIPESFFYKYDLIKQTLSKEKDLTERNNDGGYSYDGRLYFDPITTRFVFVCAYCNHFTCFDTALRLICRATTLDTCNTPKVHISVTKASITHASPPVTINPVSCAYGGILYVQSLLKADNENDKTFNTHFVIDMFSQLTGNYKGSFYIPALSDEKLQSFYILRNHILIAIYDNQIVSYQLPLLAAPPG